jgi:cyclase
MDSVASLYGRNHLGDIISEVAKDVFIPMTVGGGLRSVSDVAQILRCGADKVAVNTAAVASPDLITNIAHRFGRQCMVLSIEAKQIDSHKWEVFTENGRERTGLDVIEWAQKAVALGAGEILLTSVDREGTRSGFDLELVRRVTDTVDVPVIASGGLGEPEDALEVARMSGVDGVAMADILHYKRATLGDIRAVAKHSEFHLREYE